MSVDTLDSVQLPASSFSASAIVPSELLKPPRCPFAEAACGGACVVDGAFAWITSVNLHPSSPSHSYLRQGVRANQLMRPRATTQPPISGPLPDSHPLLLPYHHHRSAAPHN